MKSLIRVITLFLLVTGWGLAASALHVVRTADHIIVIPKDRIGLSDTYVDTRHWTYTDVRSHPEVVSRLLRLGRGDLLAGAVDSKKGKLDAQLTWAVQNPLPAGSAGDPEVIEKVTSEVHAATQAVKSVFD